MNHYRQFTAESLAKDSFFVAWVTKNDPKTAKFWKQWMHDNPDRVATVIQAKNLILAVHQVFGSDLLDEETIDLDINKLVSRAEKSLSDKWSYPFPKINFFWRYAAAVFIPIIGLLFWLEKTDKLTHLNPARQELLSERMIEKSNHSSHLVTILLGDGSVVTLEPQSSISFPAVFGAQTREVTLKGGAFFEVSKNKFKPFIVYAGESVTKVLGTSFRINSFENDAVVKVAVRSGKVLVYSKLDFKADDRNQRKANNPIVLMPNQLVELNRKNGTFQPVSIANSQIIKAPQIGPSEVSFDDRPISDVLHTLSSLYEVQIVFNESDLSKCRITTAFGEETLLERLSGICRAVGADYQVSNDKIIITSHGCNP